MPIFYFLKNSVTFERVVLKLAVHVEGLGRIKRIHFFFVRG